MGNKVITRETLEFLKLLETNNNREWFGEHKKAFQKVDADTKVFFKQLRDQMMAHDEIEKLKMFRIYRDVRFSHDKTPYKSHLAGSFSRAGAQRRGGYYLQIKPGGSFAATGFWEPEKEDLLRIRKEIELDAGRFREVINRPEFRKIWGDLQGEELKTAPKGFNREDPNIDLIRKKRFIFIRKFTDKSVIDASFLEEVNTSFRAIRPWFDMMSEILTTNLNGESVLDQDS